MSDTPSDYRNEVVNQLVSEYQISKGRAVALVKKRNAIVAHCNVMASMPYYAADEIARAEENQWPLEQRYSGEGVVFQKPPIKGTVVTDSRIWVVVEKPNGQIIVTRAGDESGVLYQGNTFTDALEEVRANAFGER